MHLQEQIQLQIKTISSKIEITHRLRQAITEVRRRHKLHQIEVRRLQVALSLHQAVEVVVVAEVHRRAVVEAHAVPMEEVEADAKIYFL